MNIILSGAYVQGDLKVEFGALPPSFLPVGLARLYFYQAEFFKRNFPDERLYMSLPASFDVPAVDRVNLEKIGIKIIKTNDEFTLEEAIINCWRCVEEDSSRPLRILHGDTLFLGDGKEQDDIVTVHQNQAYYNRAALVSKNPLKFETRLSEPGAKVLSGYFSFAAGAEFIAPLAECQEISKAIHMYALDRRGFGMASNWIWLDFGHVNTYFRSKSIFTTQRSFNSLIIRDGIVTKISETKREKIRMEALWLINLPRRLSRYIPAVLTPMEDVESSDADRYSLELLHMPTLAEVALFAVDQHVQWGEIWTALKKMLDDFTEAGSRCTEEVLNIKGFSFLYKEKTLARLSEFNDIGIDIDKHRRYRNSRRALSIRELVDCCLESIEPPSPSNAAIMHGDLCFSNVLFDSRSANIKVIDPRGFNQIRNSGCFGDQRYDIAKLYHSVVGLYDEIIAGYFIMDNDDVNLGITFIRENKDRKSMLASFRAIVLQSNAKLEMEVLAISILLFISMIPLHSDQPDRQKAFISNAYRLFTIMEEEGI